MSVRAKFKVVRIERAAANVPDGTNESGQSKWKQGELQTVILSPVYSNGDPEHENTKFWQATPQGEIKLGCVNQAAGQYFELNKEYYIDFSDPEQRPQVKVNWGDSEAWVKIARSAYEAYASSVGGRAFDGSPLPDWDNVSQPIRTAWEAAVREASAVFIGQEADPSQWAGWVSPNTKEGQK